MQAPGDDDDTSSGDPLGSTTSRVCDTRARAPSSGSLRGARTFSSSSHISRTYSNASSAGSHLGNRGSIISNEVALQDVPEIDSDVCGSNDHILYMDSDQFQENSVAEEAKGGDQHSVQVPCFISRLTMMDDKQFICKAVLCHPEEMCLDNVEKLVTEDQRTINSHVFTIGMYGYNMCLQVRIGKEEFVSIGTAIVKGKNDKELVWPFNMMILFRLKNLSGGDDLVKMFRCDKNGSRIKEATSKPRGAMNTAVGFPCFITRQRLLHERFIKNNKMHLECYFFPRDAKLKQAPEVPSIIK